MIYVYILRDGNYYYAPRVYLPRSMITRAHACCTVPEVSVKYECNISIIRKQVLILFGLGLSIGSIKFYFNIYAIIENIKI